MMKTNVSEADVVKQIIAKVKLHGGIERLGCLFDTVQNQYFYDSGTGKVQCITDEESKFFQWLFERKEEDGYDAWRVYNEGKTTENSLIEMWKAIEQEHLLEVPYPSKMSSPMHEKRLEEVLNSEVRMITLELTGRCNLRCGYCIYNEAFCENRNFSENDMSEETAKKAIDYLAAHSGKDAAVTFYGGEPLLRFPLIKECVEYSKKVLNGKNVSYSITSNMTLMTKEIAEFFYGIKGFSLVASLDGPEEIHNAYRKYPNGQGSFKDAIRGLKILADTFGDEFAQRVSISMVFAPPYTYDKLNRIREFYKDLDWLPKETSKLVSYPENGSVEYSLDETEGIEEVAGKDRVYVNTINKWTETVCESENVPSQELFTQGFYDDILLRIHKRSLSQNPTEVYGLNGCCIPGARRLYVATDGQFKPCDRIGVCPSIGNVDQGIDFDAIRKKYIQEYIEASDECENCWAKRMCGVCYAKIYSPEKISPEKKKYVCDMARHTTMDGLILYHTQLERNPQSLEYLNEIEVG